MHKKSFRIHFKILLPLNLVFVVNIFLERWLHKNTAEWLSTYCGQHLVCGVDHAKLQNYTRRAKTSVFSTNVDVCGVYATVYKHGGSVEQC